MLSRDVGEGGGTARPISSAASIQTRMASWTLATASCCVSPSLMQPGRSGTKVSVAMYRSRQELTAASFCSSDDISIPKASTRRLMRRAFSLRIHLATMRGDRSSRDDGRLPRFRGPAFASRRGPPRHTPPSFVREQAISRFSIRRSMRTGIVGGVRRQQDNITVCAGGAGGLGRGGRRQGRRAAGTSSP